MHQFEDAAVRLVSLLPGSWTAIVDKLRLELLQAIVRNDGLFNPITHVNFLRRSFHPLIEVYHNSLTSRIHFDNLPHLFLIS